MQHSIWKNLWAHSGNWRTMPGWHSIEAVRFRKRVGLLLFFVAWPHLWSSHSFFTKPRPRFFSSTKLSPIRLQWGKRQMVSSCLSGLNQITLTACPSGFYKIKPSICLTLLSLIVAYTIILLQTSNGPSISLTRQKNKCPCIWSYWLMVMSSVLF